MKVRTNYVSNSSSSSYIVSRDLTSEGIACVLLNKDTADHIRSNADIEDLELLNSFSELWVTRPITECETAAVEYLISNTPKVHYLNHELDGTPYDEDYVFGYDVAGDVVYLHLSHVKGEVMNRDAVIKLLKERYDETQLFAVTFSSNGITLDINKEY